MASLQTKEANEILPPVYMATCQNWSFGEEVMVRVEVREASLQGTFYYLRASDCMESN
jgi:hypothetical protein